jgi:hypothetical protein
MVLVSDGSRILAAQHLADTLLHSLIGLPIAPCGERVALLAVLLVLVWIPVAAAHTFDERGTHPIALDRE